MEKKKTGLELAHDWFSDKFFETIYVKSSKNMSVLEETSSISMNNNNGDIRLSIKTATRDYLFVGGTKDLFVAFEDGIEKFKTSKVLIISSPEEDVVFGTDADYLEDFFQKAVVEGDEEEEENEIVYKDIYGNERELINVISDNPVLLSYLKEHKADDLMIMFRNTMKHEVASPLASHVERPLDDPETVIGLVVFGEDDVEAQLSTIGDQIAAVSVPWNEDGGEIIIGGDGSGRYIIFPQEKHSISVMKSLIENYNKFYKLYNSGLDTVGMNIRPDEYTDKFGNSIVAENACGILNKAKRGEVKIHDGEADVAKIAEADRKKREEENKIAAALLKEDEPETETLPIINTSGIDAGKVVGKIVEKVLLEDEKEDLANETCYDTDEDIIFKRVAEYMQEQGISSLYFDMDTDGAVRLDCRLNYVYPAKKD